MQRRADQPECPLTLGLPRAVRHLRHARQSRRAGTNARTRHEPTPHNIRDGQRSTSEHLLWSKRSCRGSKASVRSTPERVELYTHAVGAISIPGGRGFSRSPRRGRSVPEKATVSSSVKMRLVASPAWSATDDTGEGVLVIELERRAAGGPGPDLEPSCGAQSAHWIRSDRAPDAPGPKSSYMKTKTTPIRRYCSGCSCSAVRF